MPPIRPLHRVKRSFQSKCVVTAFKRPAAQIIFRLQRIERWGFDPEILFIAQKLDFKIVEVPVTWGHDERSRISYLRDGSQMLKEMVEIRSNSDKLSATQQDQHTALEKIISKKIPRIQLSLQKLGNNDKCMMEQNDKDRLEMQNPCANLEGDCCGVQKSVVW